MFFRSFQQKLQNLVHFAKHHYFGYFNNYFIIQGSQNCVNAKKKGKIQIFFSFTKQTGHEIHILCLFDSFLRQSGRFLYTSVVPKIVAIPTKTTLIRYFQKLISNFAKKSQILKFWEIYSSFRGSKSYLDSKTSEKCCTIFPSI